ncbi:MFS transporter [Streptomyces sp. XM4193]|uniref:MFS transporter n=1 Tax=Streptomyces sp. XM4193 TaxID=2929782 RepID=UPI001FF91260|nr:MFS transporter [Streptomyces sp. XM4193]MCK1799001.1 MFS transporter [Streptomyces sp. XM4193]
MSARTPEPGAHLRAPEPGAAEQPATPEPPAAEVPGDLRMTRLLWPFMLASAVGLVPFTIYSTFLVPIADTAGGDVASLGQLRGLGGLAALAVGTALAPLIDRVRRDHAAAGGLLVLAVAAALGAGGGMLLLAAFCLLVGAATAVLNPALTAAAADRFDNDAAAGRAATLVTATQSLTALLAAPLVALPALLWGWQGDLWAIAAICCALALYFLLRGRRRGAADAQSAPRAERPGYLESFRLLGALPGVVPLLLIAMLRTAAFMGYLAYLAAFYDERFGLGPGMFALVWTLSGTSFFLGNLCAGRLLSAERQRVRAEPLMALALLVATAAVVGVFFTGSLIPALVLTALVGVGHAVVAACVTTLLVRRCGSLRGTALSVNAAGMSLGVFLGAGLGGVGLALGGHPGTAAALGGLTLVALLLARTVLRSAPARHAG